MAGKGLGWRLTWRGCGLRCHLTWNERPRLAFNMAGALTMLQLNMAGKRRLQILSSKRAHHPLAFEYKWVKISQY